MALSGMEMAWEAQRQDPWQPPENPIHLLHTPYWREAEKEELRNHAWPLGNGDRSSSHRPQHLLTLHSNRTPLAVSAL